MGGESGNSNIKFQNAPLMSSRQLDLLDQMLWASGNAIQDFRLGAPYRGPFYSGYSPTEFHLGGGYSGYHDPWKRGREGDGEEKKKRKEDEGGDNRKYANQSFQQGTGIGSLGSGAGGWASLLGGGMGGMGGYTGSYGGGRMGQGIGGMGAADLGFYNTYMPQMLTSPFVNPFRYGMTGNYPRMGRSGGGWASALGG